MIWAIILLILWLFLLGYSANFLVSSSVRIAQYLKVSALFIWLTIVAFGTSAPELFLSAMAAINWNWALSVWNVIGSNIFNLGFILGLSAIIAPIIINKKLVYRDGMFMLFITALIFFFLWDQHVAWREGTILISLLVGYVSYLWIKKEAPEEEDVNTDTPKFKNLIYLFVWVVVLSLISTSTVDWQFLFDINLSLYSWGFIVVLLWLFAFAYFKKDIPEFHKNWKAIILNIIKLVASLWLLVLASDHVVNAAVYIAQIFGVSEWAIGATIVAAGTSLPEVAATVTAIIKKRYDMWIWNVIWSDIFNILWVIWISSIITPLELTSTCLFVADCSTSWGMLFRDNIFSILILFLTLGVTFIFMRTGWRLSRREWLALFLFALIRMIFEVNPNFFASLFGA